METKEFIKDGKTYTYRYLNYLSLSTMYKPQKMLMGSSYYKRFKFGTKEGKTRFNKILKCIMDNVTENLTLGANVDFGQYQIKIQKRFTSKKTSTVFNNMLYIPVVSYKKLTRINSVMHDIKPNVEMHIRIRKAYQNDKYINL